jgi:hypothetical protein
MRHISDDDSTKYYGDDFGLAGYGNSLVDNTTFASIYTKAMNVKNSILGAILAVGGKSFVTASSDQTERDIF